MDINYCKTCNKEIAKHRKYCSIQCRSNDKEYLKSQSETKKKRWKEGLYINWTDKRVRTQEIEEKLKERNEKLSNTIQELVEKGEWGHEQTEEERLKKSKSMKNYIKQNPDFIENIQKQKIKDKRNKSLREYYSNEENCKKLGDAVRESMTVEIRKKISEGISKTISETNWAENVKNGYKKGYYDAIKGSKKNGDKHIWYRSSYERKAFIKLDFDSSVKEWFYESEIVPLRDGIHRTTVDLKVIMNDGTIKLIEVKPNRLINTMQNIDKFKTIKDYCDSKKWLFELWTENKL